MAADDELADRVRAALALTYGIDERRLLGGTAFHLHGHLVCGVVADDLIVRVGPDQLEECIGQEGARQMNVAARLMPDMVVVDASAVADFPSVNAWVKRGLAFARTLPNETPRSS